MMVDKRMTRNNEYSIIISTIRTRPRHMSTMIEYVTHTHTHTLSFVVLLGIGFFLDKDSRHCQPSSTYTQRQRFASVGGITPPHHQSDFDIEAYGMSVFIELMHIYGINCETLKKHICQGEMKEIINPSSSGSLLYLTSDSSYLVKTIRDYDAKFIQQKFLHEYYQYVRRWPGTFLAKLFGVFGYIPYLSQQHDITVNAFTLRFGIFANFIPIDLDIHEKYDLKGSSYRRDANMNERLKTSTTFKDNDFRDLHPSGLTLTREVYDHLNDVLTRDVNFLEQLNIMDYSLLLSE
jgi:1-phosphatidylinositol-4-phosphate 5-kinase